MKKKNLKTQSLTFTIILSILILWVSGIISFINHDEYILSGIEFLAGILLLVFYVVTNNRHTKSIDEYIKLVTTQNSTMANDAISRFPIATAILSIDGKILWYNDMLLDIFESDDLSQIQIASIMPELKWSEILKSSDGIDMNIGYKSRHYNVKGNIIVSKTDTDEKGNPVYTVLLYFIDTTEKLLLQKKYSDEKCDIAIINIDNFDDLLQKMDDDVYQNTISSISKAISAWASVSNGVLKKTDRDRYIMFFEHRYLDEYIKTKFDLLSTVRSIGEEIKIPLTLSIGIGTGENIFENEAFARAAIDMALGRGGDQAAVKDSNQFNFYGGTVKDYEKSTRVKVRAVAVALKDFISHADKVIFMGHSSMDYDCLGAAVGLSRAVKLSEVEPYIVYDASPAVKKFTDSILSTDEYKDMFITGDYAEEIITKDTLLVVLDTHRPSMLPYPELLEKADKVVVIDHHRRSTEFIENSSLAYHEPYASSTSEMVAEIMKYLDTSHSMTAEEAMAIYLGILMDTKNFLTKTGVRTFEAASFLRRYGLDTALVKQMLNVEKDDYMKKLEIVKSTTLYKDEFAIATSEETFENIKVISSQSADDMLNISGTKAAFVLYPYRDAISISARSLGEINVQVIMEKLGGGGHMTVAGAQVLEKSKEEVLELLKEAIDTYIEEQ